MVGATWIGLSNLVYAQQYNPNVFLHNRVWQFQELAVNAPGQENVWIVIVPIDTAAHQFDIVFKRDGASGYEQYFIDVPAGPLGRRVSINVNGKTFFDTGALMITGAVIHCGSGCTVSATIRPTGADFWRKPTYINAQPVVEEFYIP